MTIYYLSPGSPEGISGGTRKLYDHVALLNANGLEAKVIHTHEVGQHLLHAERDIIVVPEVYGDGIRDFVPRGWPRVVFVQNSYITDVVDGMRIVADPERHPYLTTPELKAILTESDHTTARLEERFGGFNIPLIRTHSSGNGRNGEHAGFFYGSWPRDKVVCFFDYKHAEANAAIFGGLELPPGWVAKSMNGMTDGEIAHTLRTSAIFAAANTNEGMCAPTSEAMISGAVIVCWTGGGPDEYLIGRSVIAEQDNTQALREAITDTARRIDSDPGHYWSSWTAEWSAWFQETYSRKREIDELVTIFCGLGQTWKKVDA